jgi:hypothetical protein
MTTLAITNAIKVGLIYVVTQHLWSQFADDFRSNYYYSQILIRDDQTIPASLTRNINSAEGQYEYQKKNWNGKFLYSRSVTNQSLSDLEAKLNYDFNDDYQFL